jgi:hypothetical protein
MLYSEHPEESGRRMMTSKLRPLKGSGVSCAREGLSEAMDETLQKIRAAYAQAGAPTG